MSLRLAGLAALAAIAILAVPAARAQHGELAFTISVADTGHIDFYVAGPAGSAVVIEELIHGTRRYVLTAKLAKDGTAVIKAGRGWRCDRLDRRFVATLAQPDGGTLTRAFPVRTPSCAQRLDLTAPERVRPGRRVPVHVRDRWQIGEVSARLCSGSRRPLTCRALELERGRSSYATTLPPPPGQGLVIVLKAPAQRLVRHVRIGASRGSEETDRGRDPRPRVLVTGDSLMQNLDQILRDRLADRAQVTADTQLGTALSKPGFDWLSHARRTARRLRPAATVMFLGGNEGFPLRAPGGESVKCCDEPWIDAYSRRARRVMLAYARGGTARVIWLRLPAARRDDVSSIFFAVNEALERAATGLPTVQTLPLDEVLSPGWRYRVTIPYRGRNVRVRVSDGVHLSLPGSRIAAGEVIRALRLVSGI